MASFDNEYILFIARVQMSNVYVPVNGSNLSIAIMSANRELSQWVKIFFSDM